MAKLYRIYCDIYMNMEGGSSKLN